MVGIKLVSQEFDLYNEEGRAEQEEQERFDKINQYAPKSSRKHRPKTDKKNPDSYECLPFQEVHIVELFPVIKCMEINNADCK